MVTTDKGTYKDDEVAFSTCSSNGEVEVNQPAMMTAIYESKFQKLSVRSGSVRSYRDAAEIGRQNRGEVAVMMTEEHESELDVEAKGACSQ